MGRVSSCSSHGDAGAGSVCEGTGFSPRTNPEQEAAESQPMPPVEVGSRALHGWGGGSPGASGGGVRPGLVGGFLHQHSPSLSSSLTPVRGGLRASHNSGMMRPAHQEGFTGVAERGPPCCPVFHTHVRPSSRRNVAFLCTFWSMQLQPHGPQGPAVFSLGTRWVQNGCPGRADG